MNQSQGELEIDHLTANLPLIRNFSTPIYHQLVARPAVTPVTHFHYVL